MDIKIVADEKAIAVTAARLLKREFCCFINDKMNEEDTDKDYFVLGTATGSTPIGVYGELAAMYYGEIIPEPFWQMVQTIALDEYVGLAPNHNQSYRYFMNENLFRWLPIPAHQTHLPNGLAVNPEQECLKYESLIKSLGGVNVWILGIGTNGHVAFCEPGTPKESRTMIAPLSEETRRVNAEKFFNNDIAKVPTHAYTVGIATIMEAKKIILLVSGENKQKAIYQAIYGEQSAACPASWLRSHHDCTFILDEKAGKLVKENILKT